MRNFEAVVIEGGGNGLRAFNIYNGKTRKKYNYPVGNFHRIKKNLKNILLQLLEKIDYKKEINLAVAMAGLSSSVEIEYLKETLLSLGCRKFKIMNDAIAAYKGAFNNEDGIIVISGTGSIVLSIDSDDNIHRIGGWGYLLGDEGSGFFLGKEMLKYFIECIDKKNEKDKFLKFFEKEYKADIKNLIRKHISSKEPVKDISILTYFLEKAQRDGYKKAEEIFKKGAELLAQQVILLSQQVNIKNYALRGSVNQYCDFFRKSLKIKLKENLLFEKDINLTTVGGALISLFGEEIIPILRREKDENICIGFNISDSTD